MTRPIFVRPLATADIDDAAAYLAEQSVPAAIGFLDAVEQAFSLLAERPEIGSSRFAHLLPGLHPRLWPMTGYPYLIFYVERDGVVEIIRVLHSRRDHPSVLSET